MEKIELDKNVLWIVPQLHNYYKEFKRQEIKGAKRLVVETFLPKHRIMYRLLYSKFCFSPIIGTMIRLYR